MESGLKLTSTEFGAKMSVRVHANVMYYAMGGGGGGGGPVHAYVVNPPQHAWLHPVSSSCLCALYFSKRFAKFTRLLCLMKTSLVGTLDKGMYINYVE